MAPAGVAMPRPTWRMRSPSTRIVTSSAGGVAAVDEASAAHRDGGRGIRRARGSADSTARLQATSAALVRGDVMAPPIGWERSSM